MRLPDFWMAFPASPRWAISWPIIPTTVGPWLTPWRGCRWPAATLSCHRGCCTSSPRRGSWCGGCATLPVPMRPAGGVGKGTTPAKNSPAGSASPISGPSLADADGISHATVHHRGVHGRRARFGNSAHRRRQVHLLPDSGPGPLRQDRRPHRGHLAAGGPHGRPGGRVGSPGHHFLRRHQRPACPCQSVPMRWTGCAWATPVFF